VRAAAATTREKVGTFLLRLPFLVEWRASCHERALRRRVMIDDGASAILQGRSFRARSEEKRTKGQQGSPVGVLGEAPLAPRRTPAHTHTRAHLPHHAMAHMPFPMVMGFPWPSEPISLSPRKGRREEAQGPTVERVQRARSPLRSVQQALEPGKNKILNEK